MTRRRLGRALPALALGIAASALLAAGPAAAEPQAPAPSIVSIPYEGEIEVTAAAGYVFADCAGMRAATELITACAPNGFTASAPVFDADAAPVRLPVALAGHGAALTIDYLLQLEPPPAPELPDFDVTPGTAPGDRRLVPLSMLGIECELCTPGQARIEIAKAPPRARLTAEVTGTHLVLAPGAGATEPIEVGVRVVDDLGQKSKIALITVYVSDPGGEDIVAVHARRPMPEETVTTRLSELVFAPDGTPADVVLTGCGPAVGGTATCHADGTVEYVPGSAESDQFWVRAAAPGGWQGVASVTLAPAADAAGSGLVAAARGGDSAWLEIPTAPPASEEESGGGATTALTRLLDRIAS